jgi:hypothetical protein
MLPRVFLGPRVASDQSHALDTLPTRGTVGYKMTNSGMPTFTSKSPSLTYRTYSLQLLQHPVRGRALDREPWRTVNRNFLHRICQKLTLGVTAS